MKQVNESPKQGQPNGIYTIALYGVGEFGFKVTTARTTINVNNQ
ncbi:hypothetical protein [Peribacillus alkalitolerans]|nr:hypothetical protein [Peribacillus alkalitolerans]